MNARGAQPVDVLAVMKRVASRLRSPQRLNVNGKEAYAAQLDQACAAFAEFIEAEHEYAAAQKAFNAESFKPRKVVAAADGVDPVTDRWIAAQARRRAALARVQGGAA